MPARRSISHHLQVTKPDHYTIIAISEALSWLKHVYVRVCSCQEHSAKWDECALACVLHSCYASLPVAFSLSPIHNNTYQCPLHTSQANVPNRSVRIYKGGCRSHKLKKTQRGTQTSFLRTYAPLFSLHAEALCRHVSALRHEAIRSF